ncbi:hypothetical protein [Desulfoferula mesophila]|uniref:(2Fe-2S) ferredoxin domain-containing protein n=1 Tax=Desulfoferula mesophila TaxID=3058419 RepID=A0AAU9ED05_9BACT|nr:hypothetical protein FAK_20290 [Desulfoferula mesophilus]
MFLGLKFCGGCSPDYDRSEQVYRLAQVLDGLVELVSHEDPRAERVLVVMGCKNACADTQPLLGRELILVHGEDEFDQAIKRLRAVAKGAKNGLARGI